MRLLLPSTPGPLQFCTLAVLQTLPIHKIASSTPWMAAIPGNRCTSAEVTGFRPSVSPSVPRLLPLRMPVPTTSAFFDPKTPTILYACTAKEVFRSNNSGSTWTKKTTFKTVYEILIIVVDPVTPATLYVYVDGADAASGVYRCKD